MKIAIFGLGYVGCVSAACFARDGHEVIGVDINRNKVRSIQRGESPIIEPGLTELIQKGVLTGKIEASMDAMSATRQAELVIICVGTPSKENGDLDLRYVERVCCDIGQGLRDKNDYTVIVVRSTMLPGKAQEHLIPLLERESSKTAGVHFGFCVNPEFLREGNAIADFDNPPYTILGELDQSSGDQVAKLYANIQAPIYRVPLGAAEMIKYASNSFHALKIVFANEIGNIAQAYGIDSHQVMDIFVQDTKLNLSPYYLKPGFAFGGSCLGKDTRALLYAAHQRDIKIPILDAILPSNELQIQKAVAMLLQANKRRVGLIGLSFKPNTDDLRESPAIELAERLIGKGFELSIYDHEVSLSKLHGSNLTYIDNAIPHISSLMYTSIEEVVSQVEAIIVSKPLSELEYKTLVGLLHQDQTLIDLVRLNDQGIELFEGDYRGICW